jgi:surfeit locus 1 family protein
MKHRFQPKIGATVCTVIGIVILLGLGFWQVERLEWKTAYLTKIENAINAPPIPLPEETVIKAEDWDFRAITAGGALLHGQQFYLRPRVHDGQVGGHVITPLKRSDGSILLVNRGFAPEDRLQDLEQHSGFIALEGMARIPNQTPGEFTPENDAEKDMWYWLDLPTLSEQFDLENLLPIILYQSKTSEEYPIGGQGSIDVPNNHLHYALFWFTMAGILLVIYFLYHYQPILKQKAKPRAKKKKSKRKKKK